MDKPIVPNLFNGNKHSNLLAMDTNVFKMLHVVTEIKGNKCYSEFQVTDESIRKTDRNQKGKVSTFEDLQQAVDFYNNIKLEK